MFLYIAEVDSAVAIDYNHFARLSLTTIWPTLSTCTASLNQSMILLFRLSSSLGSYYCRRIQLTILAT